MWAASLTFAASTARAKRTIVFPFKDKSFNATEFKSSKKNILHKHPTPRSIQAYMRL